MKFVEFFNIPVPVQGEPQGWVNTAAGVLELNFQALARSVNAIGQDLNAPKQEYMTLTAGEALVEGDLACLTTSGSMRKADASNNSFSTSLLGIAAETIAADSEGKFLTRGTYDTTGLSLGKPYFISTTGGTWQDSTPKLQDQISRVIGYALSTTELMFDPDNTWLKIKEL